MRGANWVVHLGDVRWAFIIFFWDVSFVSMVLPFFSLWRSVLYTHLRKPDTQLKGTSLLLLTFILLEYEMIVFLELQ